MARQFRELIGTNLFATNFKNAIRDYYTYGFKSYNDFDKSRSALNQDWDNLSKILGEKWHFEKGRYGRNRVELRTSVQSTDNPVDELYFFHNLSYIESFLNYLLELSPDAKLRHGLASIPTTEKELTMEKVPDKNQKSKDRKGLSSKDVEWKSKKHIWKNIQDINEVEYAIIKNWIDELNQEGKTASSQKVAEEQNCKKAAERGKWEADKESERWRNYPVRINRQLCAFSNSTYTRPKDRNTDIRLKMRTMETLGLVCNLSSERYVQWRNSWLDQQWRKHCSGTARKFTSKKTKSSPQYWIKSQLTMENLMRYAQTSYDDCGTANRNCDMADISESFLDMLSFFAQYSVLGEIGTILKRRLTGNKDNDAEYVFRFKHNYLQKSLYDYNLVDILAAIENQYICKVVYIHGIRRDKVEKVLIPLQIRISVMNGREYVLYYDMEEERINAFRLEFLDEIILYNKKKQSELKSEQDTRLFQQLDIAKKMLPYIWGTDVGNCRVDDRWQDSLKTYQLHLHYRLSDEAYIAERVRKECRVGLVEEETDAENPELRNITVTIKCFPTKELRNWVRSFYGRVDSIENLSETGFHYRSDVENMWSLYYNAGNYSGQDETVENKEIVDEKTVTTEDNLSNYEIVSELCVHGALFHEIFSNYAIVLADSVLACSGEQNGDLKQVLEEKLHEELGYYLNPKEETDIVEKLLYRIRESGLLQEDGEMRYITDKKDYLKQVLPLTRLECRWLLSVLEHPLAEAFLPGKVIGRLIEFLKRESLFSIQAFPIGEVAGAGNAAIFYHDRFRREKPDSGQLQWIRETCYAIRQGELIQVNHCNWKGELISDICIRPTWIEYSGRDDEIRIWGLDMDQDTNEIRIIRLSRIRSLQRRPLAWWESRAKQGSTGLHCLNAIGDSGKKPVIKWTQKKMQKLLKNTMTTIHVKFYEGSRNLPDRILTEFSLWKKKCVYDTENKFYQMTVEYSTYDEKEILIRLLGYGAYIKVESDEEMNWVCQEIKKRIQNQKILLG